jgi:hypothetical protein
MIMSTPAKDKLDNAIRDAAAEAKQNGISNEEIHFLINGVARDIEEYGLEEAIRPNEWIK